MPATCDHPNIFLSASLIGRADPLSLTRSLTRRSREAIKRLRTQPTSRRKSIGSPADADPQLIYPSQASLYDRPLTDLQRLHRRNSGDVHDVVH